MTKAEEELRYHLPELFVNLEAEKDIDQLDYESDPDVEGKYQVLIKTVLESGRNLSSLIEDAEKALVRYTNDYSDFASNSAEVNAYDSWHELPWGDDEEYKNEFVHAVFVADMILRSEPTVSQIHEDYKNERMN